MSLVSTLLVWAGVIAGLGAASAALYGRYRILPAVLTGPTVCRLDEANGCQVLFRTRYAALLGVPNSAIGLIFYLLVAAGWCRSQASAMRAGDTPRRPARSTTRSTTSKSASV